MSMEVSLPPLAPNWLITRPSYVYCLVILLPLTSIQQVMATGYIYIDALNAVSLETTNMARWRGVWGRDAGRAHRPAQSPQPNDPEGDKARQSVRMLVAQVMELGLRAELYDGTWSMS